MIMQHKLGACPISDVSIAIIVSSVHRKESLAAVDFAINELKDKVPIWKKVRQNKGMLVLDLSVTRPFPSDSNRSFTTKEIQSGKITKKTPHCVKAKALHSSTC